ncbi:MAG: hypothetical protein ACI9LT_002481, partial [Pseudoalteromonas distincta]
MILPPDALSPDQARQMRQSLAAAAVRDGSAPCCACGVRPE